MKKHICILLLLLLTASLYAQSGNDTASIVVRYPDAQKLKALQQDKDFQYVEADPELKQNLWSFILNLISDFFEAFFSDNGAAPYIRWAIMLFAFVVALIYFLKINVFNMFYSNKKTNLDTVVLDDENIERNDLDQLITQAIETQNFRKAVRLLYIKLLKILNLHELIQWQIDKTNRDYCTELKNSNYTNDFLRLTSLYEFVWYGNFGIAENTFNDVYQRFSSLYSELEKNSNTLKV